MTALIIFFVLSLIINGVLGYAVYTTLKGQDILSVQLFKLESFLQGITKRLIDADARLENVKLRGSFEADDEVGFYFTELKQVGADITEFLQSATSEEEQDGQK